MNETEKTPYVGPNPFQEGQRDLFFGRERESRDLLALAVSEPIVLFYAQSGAGKSSLVNTCLIPDLRDRGFTVFTGRVGGDAPKDVDVRNIFVFNLIRSLTPKELNPDLLATLTLSEFFPELVGNMPNEAVPENDESEPKPHTLVIDQFEEIFNTHHEAWEKREDFFRQLAQAMQNDPNLWVVLVMREDFIAMLDPYAHFLPGRFRMRYYMQRLERDAALDAIKKPVENLRPYAEGVAERLVDDLCSVKVYLPDGTPENQPGQYVEPVQLQVVCYNLWEKKLKAGGEQITDKDLESFGDVDASLGDFYADRVKAVADSKNFSERKIREWFTEKLISPDDARNMVLRESGGKSGGLEEEVIQALHDLVRAEQRGGAIFYELTHDRLVKPIKANNRKWEDEHSSRLRKRALLWNEQGRSENQLLTDEALAEEEDWAAANQDELNDWDEEFLEACRDHQEQITAEREIQRRELEMTQKLADEQKQSARRARQFNVISLGLFVITLFAAIFAFSKQQEAQKAQNNARASELSTIALDRADSQLDLAMLLGLQANSVSNTFQTRKALLTILQKAGRYRGSLPGKNFQDSLFNPNGDSFAVLDGNGITFWDWSENKLAGPFLGNSSPIDSIALNPDGNSFAILDKVGVTLWDMDGNKLGGPYGGAPSAIYSTVFSPDGRILASASKDGSLILWDGTSGEQLSEPLLEHSEWVNMVSISPDGELMASASDDQSVILWDISDPKSPEKIGDPITGFDYCVAAAVFSPDTNRKILATSQCSIGDIILWDVSDPMNPRKLPPFGEQSDGVYGLAFSPDGTKLASASKDGSVVLWDLSKQPPSKVGRMESDTSVYSVDISPDGRLLVSGDQDGSMNIWNISNPGFPYQIGDTLNIHNATVNRLHFSPDGTVLASVGFDGKLVLWDTSNWSVVSQPSMGVFTPINSVSFSPDGNMLATGLENGSILLWDISDKRNPVKIEKQLQGRLTKPDRMEFSRNGNFLTVFTTKPTEFGVEESSVLVDVVNHKVLGPGQVKFEDPEGRFLIYQLHGDNAAEQQLNLFDNHAKAVIGYPIQGEFLSITPDGRLLVYKTLDESDDVVIHLRDWNAEKNIGSPIKGKFLALNQNGNILVYQTLDNDDPRIVLWDVERSASIQTFSALNFYTDPVVSQDGTVLALTTYDADKGVSKIDLYDTTTGKSLIDAPIEGGDYPILSANGRTLLYSGSNNQGNPTIIAFDITTNAPIGEPGNGYLNIYIESGQVLIYEIYDYNNGENVIHVLDTTTGQEIALLTGRFLAIARNGEILVYEDNGVRFFDIAAGQNLGEPVKGSYLGISQDGRTLVTRNESDNVQFWDLTQTWPLGVPIGMETVQNAVLSPDGDTVAAIGKDGVILRDVTSGIERGEPFNDHVNNEFPGDTPRFSPDGRLLAIGNYNTYTTTVWDLESQEQVGLELPGTYPVFSPDGKILAVENYDSYITTVWDLQSQEQIGDEFSGDSPVFSPDGKTLAVGNYNSYTTTVWDLHSRKQIGSEFPGDTPRFSPDGRLLAIGNYNTYTTTVWDLISQEQIGNELSGAYPVFSPDGRLLAIGNYDNYTTTVWDLSLEQIRDVFPGDTPVFSPDGRLLALGDYSTALTTVWDLASRKQIGGEYPGDSPRFSPNDRLLAIGNYNTYTTTLWDLEAEEQIGNEVAGAYPVFSQDGKILAIGDYNTSTTTAWDLESGKQIGEVFPGDTPAFSSNGSTLAIGNYNIYTTTLWEVDNNNTLTRSENGRAIPPDSMIFSLDGRILASQASDGIVLRNLDSNTSLRLDPGGYDGGVTSRMSFYADDTRFIALGEDDTLITWDVSTGKSTIPDEADQPLMGLSVDLSAFSPGGKYLVYEGDGRLNVWDVIESKSAGMVELSYLSDSAGGINFSPDGTVLAYAYGKTITLYHLPGLDELGKLSTENPITNVGLVMDVNADNNTSIRYLVTLDESGNTQIWDWATRTKIGEPMPGNIQFVGSSSRDHLVVYIDSNGRLIKFISELDHAAWQQLLCPLVKRNFTQEEWRLYFPDEDYPAAENLTCPDYPPGE